jgi:hypothetical protein
LCSFYFALLHQQLLLIVLTIDHASLALPGMIGVITGISTRVGLSEKVWDVASSAGGGQPPGSYDGEADVIVERDIVQFANSVSLSVLCIVLCR